jgi:hypothetical protein
MDYFYFSSPQQSSHCSLALMANAQGRKYEVQGLRNLACQTVARSRNNIQLHQSGVVLNELVHKTFVLNILLNVFNMH